MAFLALALIGAGASYGRADDKQKAIDLCAKHIVADWSSLYDVSGKNCDINVFNIGEREELRMGHDGVYDEAASEFVPRLELVNIKLPTKKRR